MTVGLDDSRVLGFHTMYQAHVIDGKIHAPEYQIPTMARNKGSFDSVLADGSSLLISLGVHDEATPVRGAASLANGVLGLMSLPTVQLPPVTHERLVLVWARHLDGEVKTTSRPGAGTAQRLP